MRALFYLTLAYLAIALTLIIAASLAQALITIPRAHFVNCTARMRRC